MFQNGYILPALVAVGAVVFTYPVILFLRFLRLEKKTVNKIFWAVLLVMCGSFFFSYLDVFIHLAKETVPSREDAIIAMVLFAGSVFVALVARVLYSMVYNLEKLVNVRTAELERVYERALQTERETQKLKDHFIFVAAHELRSPVTSMRWSLEMIKEEESEDNKDNSVVGNLMNQLDKSVTSLAALVNDLLDTSRLEYGTIKLEPKPCVIGDTIKEALETVAPLGLKEQVKLNVDLGDAEIREAVADCHRVREVLVNLVSNAFKFTLAGGEVTVSLSVDDDDFTISVKDNGVGLSQEDIGMLFQKFSKIDNHPDKKEIQSTGLGLYIAKTLVDLWGGKIWAESEGRGKGSTFSFTIPRVND